MNVLLFVVQIMIPRTTFYLLLDECKNIFLLYLTMNVNMNIKKYLSTFCNCECNCVKYLILSDKFKLFPKMVMPVTLYHLSLKFMCREPAWGTPPVAKVMRKEARHTQRRDRASGVPLEILEHLPAKPESAYFLLCALTYTSDFTEAVPHYLSLKKELTYSSS